MDLQKIAKDAFNDELQKIALNVSSIENDLGVYLGGKNEEKTKDLVDAAIAKSFILRHPWLTGIPTLGIAPAIAHGNAVDSISRRLLRDDSSLRQKVNELRQQAIENQIRSDEANRYSNAASHLATAGIAASTIFANQNDNE